MKYIYINGAPQGIMFHENDEFTLYPASILSVNKNRFTKHYFIGNQRIASRIGSGRFNNVYGLNGSYVTAGQQDYAERMNQIEVQREEYYKKQGIAPGVPTMKGAYGDPENTGIGYNSIITELGDHSVPANWAQYVTKKQPGETPGPPIIWGEPQSPEEAEPGYGYVPDESDTEEEETFFYHSDHLGSTSYITDKDGNVTQHTAYLPYGELLIDEHSSSEDLPYKFNGKELDEEIGLYYYGARYMNPTTSIFLNTDRFREKYPQLSPYSYCAGNPVNLTDINGDTIKFAKGTTEEFKKNYRAAVKHLSTHGLGASLKELQASSRVYYVADYNGNRISYDASTYTIYWNPEYGLKTDNGSILSPTTVLNHEIGHAARHEKAIVDYEKVYYDEYNKSHDIEKAVQVAKNGFENYRKTLKTDSGNPYGSKEEERNILNNEQITALKLGEIKNGQVTRTNHRGKLVKTVNVTSNKIIEQ